MLMPNYPSEKVNTALHAASIQQSMGGLGGSPEFDINTFDEDVRPYVLAYLKGNNDSVAVTYAAMRTKELELGGNVAF